MREKEKSKGSMSPFFSNLFIEKVQYMFEYS